MLNANDLRNGTIYKDDNQLWQVLVFEHNKMGRGSGTIKVKVRNLRSGSVTEKSYITGARVEEADVEKKKVQFLYKDQEGHYFMDNASFEQFTLPKDIVGEQARFLKEGMEVELIVWEGQPLGMEIANSVVYAITETGPGEKGNTVSNVYKDATLDNGLVVKVPMFMRVGDRIKVDTRSGQYLERVK